MMKLAETIDEKSLRASKLSREEDFSFENLDFESFKDSLNPKHKEAPSDSESLQLPRFS
jgi:hypothetical protein